MGEYSRIYLTDISDRELMQFWAAVCASGRDRSVSYCMPPQDGPAFCRWMRSDGLHPWIILFRDEPCGLFYLTDRQGKTAHCHFCTLPQGTKRTKETPIGRLPAARGFGLFALGSALWEHNVSGGHILDTLVGVTPACNTEAVKYIHTLGAVDCGIVPGGCWYYDTNENVPGIITVYTREALPEWTANL